MNELCQIFQGGNDLDPLEVPPEINLVNCISKCPESCTNTEGTYRYYTDGLQFIDIEEGNFTLNCKGTRIMKFSYLLAT